MQKSTIYWTSMPGISQGDIVCVALERCRDLFPLRLCIEAGIRETLDLRDDVVFYIMNPFNGEEECSAASILPGLPDGSAGDFTAEAVCENLGEPACVQLIWDGSSLPRLKSVNYYWVCDGFYARYSNQFTNYNHGSSRDVLRYIVDNPTVVEHYMSDVAAFLAE